MLLIGEISKRLFYLGSLLFVFIGIMLDIVSLYLDKSGVSIEWFINVFVVLYVVL